VKVRIYYEDTDIEGIVYHTNYLKYCERVRSELFFQKGLSPHNEKQFFVVKSIQADYNKSAKFGDVLDIKTKLIELKKASIILEQTIYNKSKEIIFLAKIKLVYLKNNKPSKIEKEYLNIFQ
jgi:acyl-CoA thioester hydrolase